MVKSGIIIGIVGLLLGVGLTLISPICVPCTAVFLGLGGGFLAGVFDKPGDNAATIKTGALAGLIAGLILFFGHMIGAGINSILVGPEGTARIAQRFTPYISLGATEYWIITIFSTLCLGLIELALMAGFGVLGAYLWSATLGKSSAMPLSEDN